MPQITKTTITYNEKDWLAGLHPQYGYKKTISQKLGNFSKNQYNFNAFDDLGYAKNGFLGVDFDHEERVTSRLEKIILGSDGYYYAIDSARLVHCLSNAGGSISDVESIFPFPYQTGGAGTVNSDIIEHYVTNSAVKGILFSYNNGTNGDVGVIDPDTGTSTLAFMSSRPAGAQTLANAYPHPMCVGHDDKLYIGNGRYLFMYDYADTAHTDGKLFRNVLILPKNFVIKSIQKLQPRTLVIFGQDGLFYGNGGPSKAFFWDYLSLDPYQIKDLSDRLFVTSFEYKGTIGTLTYDNTNEMKVRVFNGSEFEVITRLRNLWVSSVEVPSIGCIDVIDNEIYIHMSDQMHGYIFKYGNNYNLENNLSVIGRSVAGVSGYKAGALKYIKQYDNFIMSTGLDDDKSATIQYQDKKKYATDGFWHSDLTDIGYERIQITGITVYFADEFTGGRTISISLTDRYNTYAISGLTNLATVTPTNRIYRAKPINYSGSKPIPPLDGVGIELVWGPGSGSSVTPIINKVVLDYKPIPIN